MCSLYGYVSFFHPSGSPWGHLAPRGHFTMSGNIVSCHSWGWYSWHVLCSPEMLLNMPLYIGYLPPHTKQLFSPKSQ